MPKLLNCHFSIKYDKNETDLNYLELIYTGLTFGYQFIL